MLRCPVCARPPATQACSCCFEACYISQALRLILSPRGSAPALVRHAASRINSISRHVGTCCKPFAQRGDSRSHSFATRLAACAHAAVSAARRRTVKERRKKLHPIERAMHARSREAAAAIERPGLPRLSSLEGLFGATKWVPHRCNSVSAAVNFFFRTVNSFSTHAFLNGISGLAHRTTNCERKDRAAR